MSTKSIIVWMDMLSVGAWLPTKGSVNQQPGLPGQSFLSFCSWGQSRDDCMYPQLVPPTFNLFSNGISNLSLPTPPPPYNDIEPFFYLLFLRSVSAFFLCFSFLKGASLLSPKSFNHLPIDSLFLQFPTESARARQISVLPFPFPFSIIFPAKQSLSFSQIPPSLSFWSSPKTLKEQLLQIRKNMYHLSFQVGVASQTDLFYFHPFTCKFQDLSLFAALNKL